MADVSVAPTCAWTLPSHSGAVLVTIAAAGVFGIVMFVSVVPWRRTLLDNEVSLEWGAHLFLHGGFYGTALLQFMGLYACGSSLITGTFSFAFFVLCAFVGYVFTLRRHYLESTEPIQPDPPGELRS